MKINKSRKINSINNQSYMRLKDNKITLNYVIFLQKILKNNWHLNSKNNRLILRLIIKRIMTIYQENLKQVKYTLII